MVPSSWRNPPSWLHAGQAHFARSRRRTFFDGHDLDDGNGAGCTFRLRCRSYGGGWVDSNPPCDLIALGCSGGRYRADSARSVEGGVSSMASFGTSCVSR